VIVGVLAVILCVWLVAGNLRAEALARDYFAHAHGGASVANVEVDGVAPALPPFWQVEVRGDVIEPGDRAQPTSPRCVSGSNRSQDSSWRWGPGDLGRHAVGRLATARSSSPDGAGRVAWATMTPWKTATISAAVWAAVWAIR